jgi:hypothetical protein
MEHYEEGTEVYVFDPEKFILQKGKITEWYSYCYYQYKIAINDEEHWYDSRYVAVDPKNLLIRLLWNEQQVAREAKMSMALHNEKANELCWILGELDASINIKEELNNYEKKVRGYGY